MSNLFNRAAGYENRGVSDVLRMFDPKTVSDNIIVGVVRTSKAETFAKHDLSAQLDTLMLGCEVTYPIMDEECFDTGNDPAQQNMMPDAWDFGMRFNTFKVCNIYKGERKLSAQDRRLLEMTGMTGVYSQGLEMAIQRNIRNRVEPYFWSVVAASAHASNRLTNGGVAFNIATASGIEQLLLSIVDRMTCLGMRTEFTDANDGIMLYLPPCAYRGMYEYAKEAMRGGCCEINPAFSHLFRLPTMGISVMMCEDLPRDPSGAFYAVWGDPRFVAFPWKWNDLNWYSVKNDDYLIGEFVFDAHVIYPKAVGTALVTP